MTAITAQDLQDLSMRDVRDMQRIVPGLYISSFPASGRAKLTIRGQNETDDKLTADRAVGVYIDGVSFEHQYGLTSSLVDIAQVETLRGPQGTLFGRNTTGGALNITTQRPTYELGGYIDALYGSEDNVQLLGVLNAPIVDDRLAVRIVGQSVSRDGYFKEFDGHESGDDDTVNGRIHLRADPMDNVRILLSADIIRVRNTDAHLVLTNDSMLAAGNTARGALGAIASQLGLNPSSTSDRLAAYDAWREIYDAYQSNPKQGFGNAYEPTDELDNNGAGATIEVDFGSMTAKSITGYRHLSRKYSLDLDATPFDLLFARQSTTSNFFSQELQLLAIDGEGLDWQVGAFYHRETGTEFAAADTLNYVNPSRTSITENDVANSSRAIYTQAVYHLTPSWNVTGGVRYTKDSREIVSRNRIDLSQAIPLLPAGGASRCAGLAPALGGPVFPNCDDAEGADFDEVTWLASVDWAPVSDVTLYGSISKGYRSGGFTPPGAAVFSSVAERDAAFTPYEPETVTNYEIGVKSEFAERRVRLNSSVYYQDYKNVQQRVRDTVNGLLVTLIRNAADATLYGGEIELSARPTQALTLDVGVAYLNAQFDEFLARDASGNLLDLSSQPFSAPEWTYNAGATYTLDVGGGSVRFNANYSWTDDVNHAPGTPDAASVTQASFGMLDARISWLIDSADLDIAVFGRNLTDEQYISFASNAQALGWNVGYMGAPRVYGVQVRKNF
jgi:iron complex outermembrane receptor protein